MHGLSNFRDRHSHCHNKWSGVEGFIQHPICFSELQVYCSPPHILLTPPTPGGLSGCFKSLAIYHLFMSHIDTIHRACNQCQLCYLFNNKVIQIATKILSGFATMGVVVCVTVWVELCVVQTAMGETIMAEFFLVKLEWFSGRGYKRSTENRTFDSSHPV